jgi:hypothetical protein
MLGHTVEMPADLIGITELLVPELQRRGRFRTDYRGRTVRENLAERTRDERRREPRRTNVASDEGDDAPRIVRAAPKPNPRLAPSFYR